MAGLQRSAQTFRRSGSSGLVWDERFLTEGAEEKPNDGGAAVRRQPELRHSRSVGSVGMLLRRRGRDDAAGDVDDKKRKLVIKATPQKDRQKQEEQEPAAPSGMKAFRTKDVAPAAEPPSPRVSGCVLCAIFRGSVGQWRGSSARRARPRKR